VTRLPLLVLTLGAIALTAGCGSSKNKPKATIPAPTIRPSIVAFSGPDAVPCGKKGQVKTVSFRYETKNATSVGPEIDGQNPGAQAGYPPHKGTMRFSYACPGPHTLTISAFNQKGQSVSKSAQVVPYSGGAARGVRPRIVKFKGPHAVPCGKNGQAKTVPYEYATKNAVAVEPEIDGQSIGAQAGYEPKSGTMRFPYICPGPHTMTIIALGKSNQTAKRSAGVEPESSG
jgi:hypothetical protein